jgi:GTP diphosphokinase / guanosine-3',5'-bis(diphosphate) 3'-diphosphatase
MLSRFGEDVASLVEEVTDDKSLPKAVRKGEQIKTAPKKSLRAKILKLADKTSNLRAVAASPAANWSVKRR